MSFLFYICLSLFLVLSIVLSLTILAQESSDSGLGASFGSATPDSVFGSSTATLVQKFTAYLAVAFIVGAIALSIWSSNTADSDIKALRARASTEKIK